MKGAFPGGMVIPLLASQYLQSKTMDDHNPTLSSILTSPHEWLNELLGAIFFQPDDDLSEKTFQRCISSDARIW